MMGNDCAYCSSFRELNNGEPTIDEVNELFHQPCSSCSSLSSLAESMCYSCQHLRFRHLMICMRIETCKKFMFPLRKGLAVEDDRTTQCPLCRVVERIVLRAFDPAQCSHLERTYSTLILDLKQSRQEELGESSISSAEVYVHYDNGNATSFDWVVDLHISDTNKVDNFPYVREMVSWTHLKDKMSECYERHEGCQYKAKEGLPKGFRVIDVIRRAIVEMNDCSFVALSYVWGLDTRPSLLTATCATIEEMKKDGGLPASEMPQTIEDAMSVCAQLGERYLWADRLCIIQDNAEDKGNQINAMNEIYSLARLVLMVAYGDSMDFGIPGIGHPREVVQYHEDVSGLRVTNIIREIEGDPLALWHTRGWTYQEAVLAKRRLYFTNVRTFFECEQSVCHEDQCNPEKLRNEFTSHGLLIADDGSRFASFARHLKNYTSRSLTYPSDTYNAITGISKALYDTEGVFLNGLPQVDFDRALRWYVDIGNNFTTPLKNPGLILPTWSWSSAMSLSDRVDYQATKLYGTLVPWYESHVSSPPALLEAFNTHIETIMDDDWQLYMAVACSEGCVANLSYPLLLKSINFSTVREQFNVRWQSYHTFFRDAVDLVPITETQQTSLLSQKSGAFLKDLKPGVILTRAQTTFLRLTKIPQTSGLHIIDSRGEFVGELCGDVIRLGREVASPQHDKKTLYEFMALSLSGKRITTYSGEERKTKNYFDANGSSLAMLPIVNVLMIAWHGSYAYRQELGWIYLVDWAKARREWKVVFLK